MNPAVGDKLTLSISDIAFGGEGVARTAGPPASEPRGAGRARCPQRAADKPETLDTSTMDDSPDLSSPPRRAVPSAPYLRSTAANPGVPPPAFVIFVPFVAVGEEVEAEITEVKKNFARAKLLKVLKAAPERVTPPCPYFGDCGGCQYQHLAYGAQLELKHKQIADLFERIGKFDASVVAPVAPCPQPYGYRNRIMIRSQWDKFKQGLNIGFIRADSRLVVDVAECKIAEPALNEEIKRVRANPPPKGGIKVVLRIAPEGWTVPKDSFFQNNFFLLPKLVETVRGALAEAGAKHLLDVYCGVGFFSIELAGAVETFIGVELDQLAIAAARKNAASRGVTNGEFIAGAAEELLPGLLSRLQPELTTVLLDPPRKGCPREMLELLRATRPAQIIYVSCHPATMARDLNVLCADDVFSLARVTPLDMFPQTQHVESVADIRRNV